MTKKIKLIFIIATIIVSTIVGFFIYINQGGFGFGNALTGSEAAEKAINFVNENMLQQGITASLAGEVIEESGVYKFSIGIEEELYDFYVTMNGKLLFTQGIALDKEESQEISQEISQEEIPEFKLFVFSYCPYSLQYEKGLFSVVDLFGEKVSIDLITIGAMHGEHEEIESKRQICIREEQKDKYWDYLECFSYSDGIKDCSSKFYGEFSGDESNMATCVEPYINQCFDSVGVNKENLTTCLEQRVDVYYDYEVSLAKENGVGGSPTPMLNNLVFDSSFCSNQSLLCGRSPELIKQAICEGFKTKPLECSEVLSVDVLSPGFGQGQGSSNGGTCN